MDPLTLTPGQLAARKAVETRRANEAAALDQHVKRQQRDVDAKLRPMTSGKPGGWMVLVEGVVWFFPNRQRALDYARGRFNLTEG